MHRQPHLGKRIFGIPAEEVAPLLPYAADLLLQDGHQSVEITFLRMILHVEPHTVGHDETVDHAVEPANLHIQVVRSHTNKLDRQSHRRKVDVLPLVDIPVELRDEHLVAAPGLDMEHLAVLLNLQEHHPGIVHIAPQAEMTRGIDLNTVEQHLAAREHIVVTIQFHSLAGGIGGRADNLHIGLGHNTLNQSKSQYDRVQAFHQPFADNVLFIPSYNAPLFIILYQREKKFS